MHTSSKLHTNVFIKLQHKISLLEPIVSYSRQLIISYNEFVYKINKCFFKIQNFNNFYKICLQEVMELP